MRREERLHFSQEVSEAAGEVDMTQGLSKAHSQGLMEGIKASSRNKTAF